jgi:hypothetical protein
MSKVKKAKHEVTRTKHAKGWVEEIKQEGAAVVSKPKPKPKYKKPRSPAVLAAQRRVRCGLCHKEYGKKYLPRHSCKPPRIGGLTLTKTGDEYRWRRLGINSGPVKRLDHKVIDAEKKVAGVSDGSTASYYELPKGATELQHLISYKNMNSQIGEILRSCYRYGQSSHSDQLRDAKKIKFYIDAELERLEKWT